VKTLFAGPDLDRDVRRLALSDAGLDGVAAAGPTICACFGVGLLAIRDAIVSGGATNPEAIGQVLRAGTNCGSCVPELKRIIARELAPQTR
jgi:assimilatory nitrate reductase catalytic subunit